MPRRYGKLRGAAVQLVCILLASAALAGGFHALTPDGYLRNREHARAIEILHASLFLPRITLTEARALHKSGVVFVDARPAAQFEAGHIPGAINLYAGITTDRRRSRLWNVQYEQTVVIYCSSPRCRDADNVAGTLLSVGYEDVRLFPGGYEQWKAAP
ncbi:MAG: rhodanese-like domain-containing protein [Tepidisphaeraceae bacterium]